jgi:hypothetical protein
MKIGLSISFCVRCIASGEIAYDDVTKIIAGTRVPDGNWEDVITTYKEIYWSEFPTAEGIFRRLLAEGKVTQPRLTTGKAPYVGGGVWVESEDQIIWS